jgi:glycosyltransferase involved in cell wall biosynthesis
MIIQAGIYPPPIGGVSMYMKRFKEHMDSEGIENELWDVSSTIKSIKGVRNVSIRKLPLEYWKMSGKDLIHYNLAGVDSKNYIAFFNKLLFRKRKKVLTIHGKAVGLFSGDEKRMLNTLNSFDAVICVKENDKAMMEGRGVKTRVYEIPAFIPPTINQAEIDEIPQDVWRFISGKDFIVSANGFRFNFHNDQDLYGTDLCVELCARLKKDVPNIGFVFSLSGVNNKEYYEELQRRIKSYGIEDNFLFITNSYQFYPILMKSSLFVRPTNTDGDALSIREAVNFGIPTLTSDVVERPKGVSLFKNRDIDDFYLQAKKIIENYEEHKKAVGGIRYENNAEKIINVYRELMGNNYGLKNYGNGSGL